MLSDILDGFYRCKWFSRFVCEDIAGFIGGQIGFLEEVLFFIMHNLSSTGGFIEVLRFCFKRRIMVNMKIQGFCFVKQWVALCGIFLRPVLGGGLVFCV